MTRQHIKLIQNNEREPMKNFYEFYATEKKVKELIVFHNKPFLFVLV